MHNSLMPAFRLVGAQIKTARAEISKPRPKGSASLTREQKLFRTNARRWYGEAFALYLIIEQDALSDDGAREILKDASAKAMFAQSEWRKAHPSDERLIELVKI